MRKKKQERKEQGSEVRFLWRMKKRRKFGNHNQLEQSNLLGPMMEKTNSLSHQRVSSMDSFILVTLMRKDQ
jgi:hypothetical protein